MVMPAWDGNLYLRFEPERTRPAHELANRITIARPRRVVDLGCGPGNSTAVLANRWPDAVIAGVDSSEAMLERAREACPDGAWHLGDIAGWVADEPVDVVFSNAALQWVPHHRRQFPRLLDQVAPGGVLAVQMPANMDAAPHALMREVARLPSWRSWFRVAPREWHVHPGEGYYDMLAGHASRVDIWTTEYLHVVDSIHAIVEWYRGTGLRPWLEALPDEVTRERFLADYRAHLTGSFTPRADGRMLFPFRRLFIVAYR